MVAEKFWLQGPEPTSQFCHLQYGLGIVFHSLGENKKILLINLRGLWKSHECSALSITGPMKAIIITHHCVVGGQRRKRELGRSCQGGLDGGHWSKVDLGGRKGLGKAEKSFLPRGTEGGICILWGRDESKETWPNLQEGFWLRNHMENKFREIRESQILKDLEKIKM